MTKTMFHVQAEGLWSTVVFYMTIASLPSFTSMTRPAEEKKDQRRKMIILDFEM